MTELPGDYIQLTAVVIIVLAPIVGGLVHLRMQQSATNKKINEVHEQTVNDHQQKSNLRDDMDTTRDATLTTRDTVDALYSIMRDVQERQMAQGRELGGMRADMTGVRADMTGMRTDITGVNERLNDERKRSISTDEQLWRAILNRAATDGPPAL